VGKITLKLSKIEATRPHVDHSDADLTGKRSKSRHRQEIDAILERKHDGDWNPWINVQKIVDVGKNRIVAFFWCRTEGGVAIGAHPALLFHGQTNQ
jgi:hypothetical protein